MIALSTFLKKVTGFFDNRIVKKLTIIRYYFQNGERIKKIIRFSKAISAAVGFLMVLITVFYLYVFMAPIAQELFIKKAPLLKNNTETANNPKIEKTISRLNKEVETLNRRYNLLTPKQNYLVINTTDNHFFLYRDRTLVREGFVSTGSYVRLQSHDDREWLFRTPKGKHTVKGKVTSPVWRKPDWAFVEEGLPVPSASHSSRYEAGVLGDYALTLGDGYMIHGTLYKRFLGMPVTHGCIRLNDEDLEHIFKSLSVGSHVYIY